MDLKSLVHREIGEGLAEEELASVVGVSVRTIADILVGELPQDQAIWKQFARHFRIHADLLRFDGPPHAEGLFDLISENNEEQHNALCIVRAHDRCLPAKTPSLKPGSCLEMRFCRSIAATVRSRQQPCHPALVIS